MGKLYDKLMQDIRFIESMKACINCGTCTAICPAAEFYNYDPRIIAVIVQSKDDSQIIELLKGEAIWYCGECMSCKTRCPRGNAPGLIIMALRALSQDLGYFVESEKGRQQLVIKRNIGQNILDTGYCVQPELVNPATHPEQGPLWKWLYENIHSVMMQLGTNHQGNGAGALRKIADADLDEIRKIFEVTGGLDRLSNIEEYSRKKAGEMGLQFDESKNSEYFREISLNNDSKHTQL